MNKFNFNTDDRIFIGFGLNGHPIVGKIYKRKLNYSKIINQIEKVVPMLELNNNSVNPKCKQVYLTNGVNIKIKEQKENIYINITFDNSTSSTTIEGITDIKSDGYYQFIKSFKEQHDLVIVLACEETKDELHICGVSTSGNINIIHNIN